MAASSDTAVFSKLSRILETYNFAEEGDDDYEAFLRKFETDAEAFADEDHSDRSVHM